MSPLLPRYLDHHAEDERAIAKAVLETGEQVPVKHGHGIAGGDQARLRGIPVIARGVGGTSPGTRPDGRITR